MSRFIEGAEGSTQTRRVRVIALALVAAFAAWLVVAGATTASAAGAFQVTITVGGNNTVTAGDNLTVSGTVTPAVTGTVAVQGLTSNGDWATLTNATLSGTTFSTTVSYATPGIRVLRIFKSAQGGQAAGNSPIAFVNVKKALWLQISTGRYFTCGVKTTHTAWCWGLNSSGQLGTGTTTDSALPKQIGTDANWKSVSAGEQSACGVTSTGKLYCWGDNTGGDLGTGSNGSSSSPVRVGTSTKWTGVSVASTGSPYVCALKSDGTAWCWGSNTFGQLGDGVTGAAHNSNVPVQVGTSHLWTKITVGLYSTCGLQSDGTAWCWGDNRAGQLGNGTAGTNTDAPARVGSATTWKSITTAGFFTCGVRTNGTAWCWGDDSYGQLGEDGATHVYSPAQVGTGTDWVKISAGYFFACGIHTDQTADCWGYNQYGQLGDDLMGAGKSSSVPETVQGGSIAFVAISSGVDAACGLDADQTAWCWGRNDNGQLGDTLAGASFDSDTPKLVEPTLTFVH